MANILKVKRSSVAGKIPLTTDIDLGELAINTYDGKLFLKKNVSGTETIVDIGSSSGGGGGGSGISYQIKTANYTAASGDTLYCNTTNNSFIVTLPATPSITNTVVISSGPAAGTNALTVARNGQSIMGISDDMQISNNNITVTFLFDGITWRIA